MLAADVATVVGGPWAAIAMVVVGLLAAVAGLAILTSRGREPPRGPQPRAPQPLFTARAPRAGSATSASATSTATATSGDAEPVAAPVLAAPVPAAARSGERAPTPAPEDCDWELRVDLADGAPTVIRPAAGRVCCVHVLRVRSLDAVPATSEREERSWSGERTRIGPSRAVSEVHVDSREVRPVVRGLDLGLQAGLSRATGSPMITTAEDASVDRLAAPTAEELWATHLGRLRDAGVVSEPDQLPTRLQTAVMHRTEIDLHTTRPCSAPGHLLDVRADVMVRAEGTATPVRGSRVGLPTVAGWVEGDLEVAAVDPVEVAPDTDAHPAPGAGAVPGMTLAAAPGSGGMRGLFAGHASAHADDAGIRVLVGSAVVADLGVGEGPAQVAEGKVAVETMHDLRLVVSPPGSDPAGDDPDRADLGCACTPEYEVQFGGPSGTGPHAAHARIHVDGRVHRLDAVARPGAVPSWTVAPPVDDHDDTPTGTTG